MAFRMKRTTREKPTCKSMDALMDNLDEERARILRHGMGLRRWIVSWSLTEEGPWLARVSGPGHAETIERSGLTRIHAIELAAEELGRCLKKS